MPRLRGGTGRIEGDVELVPGGSTAAAFTDRAVSDSRPDRLGRQAGFAAFCPHGASHCGLRAGGRVDRSDVVPRSGIADRAFTGAGGAPLDGTCRADHGGNE